MMSACAACSLLRMSHSALPYWRHHWHCSAFQQSILTRVKLHRFLERMAAEAAEAGAAAGGAYQGVPLRVVENQV